MTFITSNQCGQKLQYHLGDLEVALSRVEFVKLQALHNPINVAHNFGAILLTILGLVKAVVLIVCNLLSEQGGIQDIFFLWSVQMGSKGNKAACPRFLDLQRYAFCRENNLSSFQVQVTSQSSLDP